MAHFASRAQDVSHALSTDDRPQNMLLIGIVLAIAGVALMVAEAHVPTHGVLGTGAAAGLTAGVILTLVGAGFGATTVVAAGIVVALVGAAVVWMLIVQSLATHRLAVRSGTPALLGRTATVRTPLAPVGQVLLDGALWRARLWEEEGELAPVAGGSTVVIESIEGLTLTVRPAEEWEMR
jgi:membrane-bound ClpP family serine protease